MYERLTKLLEAELLRMTGDEENIVPDEHKEIISLSPSIPLTHREMSITEKSVSERSAQSTNNPPVPDESDTKSSSTRVGRNAIVYDEAGNQCDADELERKQKNPYRWFIEKQREKQQAKGPTKDEEATSAMVNFLFLKLI
jgi:hypothetical protein